jgi:hypothetical protein
MLKFISSAWVSESMKWEKEERESKIPDLSGRLRSPGIGQELLPMNKAFRTAYRTPRLPGSARWDRWAGQEQYPRSSRRENNSSRPKEIPAMSIMLTTAL